MYDGITECSVVIVPFDQPHGRVMSSRVNGLNEDVDARINDVKPVVDNITQSLMAAMSSATTSNAEHRQTHNQKKKPLKRKINSNKGK